MKTILIMLPLILLIRLAVSGQNAELLKDINPGTASSYISYMTLLGDKVIFKATNSGYTNNEPWVSDGTESGTFMLKEINESTSTGSSMGPAIFYNGEVYFSANDGVHGAELWKTDGSSEGTVMVKDIAPGITSSNPGDLAIFNNILYFRAFHPETGSELWQTQGTAESTQIVKDLTQGEASTQPGYMYPSGCGLYFNGLNNLNLYFSDGTIDGTFLISDGINVGQLDEPYFTEWGDAVYFRAVDEVSGTGSQLWKTITNAVERVTGIVSETIQFDPKYLTVAGGKLFFAAEQYPYGRELWVYDDQGIHMVKDINKDGHGNLSGGFFIEFKGKLIFSAGDATTSIELWVSDGTEAGTNMLSDICPGSCGSQLISPVIIGDTLYFSANDGTGGELWRLTSPDVQPEKFTDIANGGAWGPELVEIHNTFLFNGANAAYGDELWKMTVTETNTIHVQKKLISIKIYPNPASDFITIEFPFDQFWPTEIYIYNSAGILKRKQLITEKHLEIELKEKEWTSGLYFIKVINGENQSTKKLLILK